MCLALLQKKNCDAIKKKNAQACALAAGIILESKLDMKQTMSYYRKLAIHKVASY
jgi:hypothetical protein